MSPQGGLCGPEAAARPRAPGASVRRCRAGGVGLGSEAAAHPSLPLVPRPPPGCAQGLTLFPRISCCSSGQRLLPPPPLPSGCARGEPSQCRPNRGTADGGLGSEIGPGGCRLLGCTRRPSCRVLTCPSNKGANPVLGLHPRDLAASPRPRLLTQPRVRAGGGVAGLQSRSLGGHSIASAAGRRLRAQEPTQRRGWEPGSQPSAFQQPRGLCGGGGADCLRRSRVFPFSGASVGAGAAARRGGSLGQGQP